MFPLYCIKISPQLFYTNVALTPYKKAMPERHSSGTWLYGKRDWLTGTYEEEAGVLEGNFNPRAPNASVEVDGVDLFIEDVVDTGKKAGLFIELAVDDKVKGLVSIGLVSVAFVVIIDPLLPNRAVPARFLMVVIGKLPGRNIIGNAVNAVSRRFCRSRFITGRRPVAGHLRVPAVGEFASQGQFDAVGLGRAVDVVILAPTAAAAADGMRRYHVFNIVVEVGQFAEGLAPFAFIADVPILRFFRLQVGIAQGQDAHVGIIHVEFADARRLVAFTPIDLEAVVVVEEVRRPDVRRRLAAKLAVMIVADGRDDDPFVADEPFVLDVGGIGADVLAVTAVAAEVDAVDAVAIVFRAVRQGMVAVDLMAVLTFNPPNAVLIRFAVFLGQGRIGQEAELIQLAVEGADHIIVVLGLPGQAQAGVSPFRFQLGVFQADDAAPGPEVVFLMAPVAGQLVFIVTEVEVQILIFAQLIGAAEIIALLRPFEVLDWKARYLMFRPLAVLGKIHIEGTAELALLP